MIERIVIGGAGGFGREVYHLIDCKRYEPVGFIDTLSSGGPGLPLPIIGDDNIIPELRSRGIASCACVAIGNRKRRKVVSELVLQNDLKMPQIIHPSAVLMMGILIGAGTIIYPQVVVMNDCIIGQGVLLNTGVTLGHDVSIGDFCNVNPGSHLAGRIKVGQGVMIGIGTSIRENVTIGDDAIIGAGSVVVNDVAPGTTVYGVPALAAK